MQYAPVPSTFYFCSSAIEIVNENINDRTTVNSWESVNSGKPICCQMFTDTDPNTGKNRGRPIFRFSCEFRYSS